MGDMIHHAQSGLQRLIPLEEIDKQKRAFLHDKAHRAQHGFGVLA